MEAEISRLSMHDRAVLALTVAVRHEYERSLKAGLPMYVWRNNRVYELSGGELALTVIEQRLHEQRLYAALIDG